MMVEDFGWSCARLSSWRHNAEMRPVWRDARAQDDVSYVSYLLDAWLISFDFNQHRKIGHLRLCGVDKCR
jgi:hypothetical protein